MGEGEPRGQLTGGLAGRGPVERHHGTGDAGRAGQLRAQRVADGTYLDQVRAPADGFFEVMNVHDRNVGSERLEPPRRDDAATATVSDLTNRAARIKRSVTRRRRPHGGIRPVSSA